MRLAFVLIACTALAVLSVPAQAAPPSLPCQSGIGGSECTVNVGQCYAGVGYRTGGEPDPYTRVGCKDW